MRKQAAVRQSDVLGILHEHEKPMTAYAILDQMKLDEPDLAAPTIYRALAALTDQGRAHKPQYPQTLHSMRHVILSKFMASVLVVQPSFRFHCIGLF